MAIEALGYLYARSNDLSQWDAFGCDTLGFQLEEKTQTVRRFRMDDRKQRLVVEHGADSGLNIFGWEVRDKAALEKLAARLDAAGVVVAWGARALADERHVEHLIHCLDPLHNRLELFCGGETSDKQFAPGRSISGFRTGSLGLGHVVLNIESDAQMRQMHRFYREVLRFKLTDYYTKPFEAYFFHLNERHHSLAFIRSGKAGVHHVMVELFSLDDVGQAYDLALGGNLVATTLGRHTSDFITSFYLWSPSKFMIEYGWGARSIDPQTWQPYERTEGPSLWGHDRNWLLPEQIAEARAMQLERAAKGARQPVQVMPGNFELTRGVCPWWDHVASAAKSR